MSGQFCDTDYFMRGTWQFQWLHHCSCINGPGKCDGQ